MKKSNHSTKEKKVPRQPYRSKWREAKEAAGDYSNQKGRPKEEWIGLAKEMYYWSKEELDDPNSRRLSLRRFWIDKDILYGTAYEKCELYPEFKYWWDKTKQVMGDKRETGMLKKELAERSTAYTLHRYLDEYKHMDKYHADLKNIKDAVAALLGVEFELPNLEGKE